MTISAPGGTFEVQLEEDEFGVLWLLGADGTRYQLAVVLQGAWRIVQTTAAEQAMLEAHGFGSRRIQ
jgi:hypothetical protein